MPIDNKTKLGCHSESAQCSEWTESWFKYWYTAHVIDMVKTDILSH